MIALALALLALAAVASLATYAATVAPVATYCVGMALTGMVLTVLGMELADAGQRAGAALGLGAGAAAQLCCVAMALHRPGRAVVLSARSA